jgi:hypothetical protein
MWDTKCSIGRAEFTGREGEERMWWTEGTREVLDWRSSRVQPALCGFLERSGRATLLGCGECWSLS